MILPILISILIDSTPPASLRAMWRYPYPPPSGPMVIVNNNIFDGSIDTLKNIKSIKFCEGKSIVAVYGRGAIYGVIIIKTKP